ncbi:hypothetical protein LY76DRAFT_589887 [Colletotrichum caudatum]|nr:hypothetical protein LY76DRAFT_589887 [Colletotrichum caudatum]
MPGQALLPAALPLEGNCNLRPHDRLRLGWPCLNELPSIDLTGPSALCREQEGPKGVRGCRCRKTPLPPPMIDF